MNFVVVNVLSMYACFNILDVCLLCFRLETSRLGYHRDGTEGRVISCRKGVKTAFLVTFPCAHVNSVKFDV